MAGYVYRGGVPHPEQTNTILRPGADPERAARMAELRRGNAAGPHRDRSGRGGRGAVRRRAIIDQEDR